MTAVTQGWACRDGFPLPCSALAELVNQNSQRGDGGAHRRPLGNRQLR